MAMTAPTTSARRDDAASTPIADLALVSDCNSAALIDRDGTVQWLCLPRFDSPALFAGILDPDAGRWSIRPVGPYTSGRSYREGSLVLETTFVTPTGTVRVVDALVLPQR